jgi:hypothetical protein
MREWVVPECLLIPVAAYDLAAIESHVGEIIKVISPNKAYLVQADPLPTPDLRLPIFSHPNIALLQDQLQIWVTPKYSRYRQAWRSTLGNSRIEGRVLHHVYNRRSAHQLGIEYVRIVPISRSTNSSSAFTENWGVALNTPERAARLRARGFRIHYADLGHMMTMLDIALGGGVQEVFRIGQNLIEIPGVRPAQV